MKSIIASLSIMLLLSLSSAANADNNPFGMSKVSTQQIQLAEGKCGDSMKKGEGKCGDSMKKGEGKCGD
ncbi:MAG: hypothetical protein OQK72_00415, partial [Gammaproteobacteria bacterium]|nr:hypothetical protein [Gammaproteobacteria bacterium]